MDINTQSLKLETELLLKLGFEKPTEIQSQSMPILAEGDSLLGLAPTGSGKTLAFLLPLMCRLDPSLRKVQLLVLTPTRELGLQISQVAEKISKLLPNENNSSHLLVRTAFGGQRSESQKEEILKNPAVLVATPGRILEHLERGTIEIDALKAIVLDEADLMVGMGFETQVAAICDFLPKKFQAALFSATESESQSRLQNRLVHRATRVDVRGKNTDEANSNGNSDSFRHQYWTIADRNEKDSALLELMTEIRSQTETGIVFCQTRENVQRVVSFLRDAGISAEALSGELGQVERTTVLRRFKSGGLQYLVATNLASRGIDVKELSVVINFDLPSTPEEYIHRAGRSGRAGSPGWAISLCSPQSLDFLRKLMAEAGIAIKKFNLTSEKQSTATQKSESSTPESEQYKAPSSFGKIHINKGKSSKIRPGDILGALTKEIGLNRTQVGGIFIFDHFSHVEVEATLIKSTMTKLAQKKIKNLSVKVSEAETLSAARGRFGA